MHLGQWWVWTILNITRQFHMRVRDSRSCSPYKSVMRNEARRAAPRVQAQGGEKTPSDANALRAAIDALLGDNEALGRLYRFAERTARLPSGSPLARAMIYDAVGDLLLGDDGCDAAATLEARLRSAVRRCARPQLRSTREIQVVPLDAAPDSALVIEPAPSDAHIRPDAAELRTRIRAHARDDDAALQLLALYERGIVRRRDVLRAGMDAWRYPAAKQRLTRYATAALSGTGNDTPDHEPPADE